MVTAIPGEEVPAALTCLPIIEHGFVGMRVALEGEVIENA